MEDNTKLIESLLERATAYGKASYELASLNVVDKASDRFSSFLPQLIVVAIGGFIMLFLNLGIAFWLGEILGEFYFGFLVVAAFYGFVAIIMHHFMYKWLKRIFYDYMIKQLLK